MGLSIREALVVIGLLVAADGKWSFQVPSESSESDLGVSNSNSKPDSTSFLGQQHNFSTIFSPGDPLVSEQVTLSLSSQWTTLLDNLNSINNTHYAVDTDSADSDESFGPNGTRVVYYDDFLTIPRSLIVDSFSIANENWLERQRKIERSFIHNEGADAKSPVGTAFAFSPPSEDALTLSNTSILLEFASRAFLLHLEEEDLSSLDQKSHRVRRGALFFEDDDGQPISSDNMDPGIHKEIDLRSFVVNKGSMGAMKCGVHDEVLPCDGNNPYRTYSGWCNNMRNPGWGKSVITFDRMIPSRYHDGVSRPRSHSAMGRLLPSPRHVSAYVHVDVSHLSNKHTLMLMQYAQFLDHDLTLTPVHKGPEDKILNCRECDSASSTHPECYPIPVPTGDSWYPSTSKPNGRPTCIPFTRSLPGQQRLGPREQINQNSAYIDASQIYGEEVCKADSLRIRGGKLNATAAANSGRKPLMPQTSTLKECKSPSGYCFNAGDPRASEQPALASVHTIFLRQHNQWADDLRRVNSHWNDEKVYQEVRRIMGAVNQHITYNELLPRILGPGMINAYKLRLQPDGYYAGYDHSCSATIYNEFAAAAFRFGHSLIRPQLARMDGRYNGMSPHLQLRDGFFNSDMLYKPLMVDEVIRGLVAEPMEQLDPFITNEITNHLFEDKRKSFSGLDLISLNLQRGRDHGLPGYNHYRSACNLKKANSFQDLAEIPNDVLQRMQKVYAHVDDIDLFTGSLVERPVTGGILGPVMTCIIGTQFKKLRQCDRFWYETNDKAVRFSPQQLAEIRKLTLGKLVCDNMDVPTDTQRWVMDAPHNILNPRMPCHRMGKLNVEAWREVSRPQHMPQPQALVSPRGPPAHNCNIGGKSYSAGGSALQSPCVSCICTAKGTKCASLRITSCSKLFSEASRNDIMRDPVCTRQCGFYMGNAPNRSSRLHG